MDLVQTTTIGFTKSSAEHFFERLKAAGVRRVIDVRLHNTSQLAGFAKADDLAYFLMRIGDIDYRHEPLLAPTDEILNTYKKQRGAWEVYEADFLNLMKRREVEHKVAPALLDGACLLCSEANPHHCHRKLVCEYLNEAWGGSLSVRHL
jgi:uncharacterized protein (DUF488 family)